MILYTYKDAVINLSVMALIEKGRENQGELNHVIVFRTSSGHQFHIPFSSEEQRNDEYDRIMYKLRLNA